MRVFFCVVIVVVALKAVHENGLLATGFFRDAEVSLPHERQKGRNSEREGTTASGSVRANRARSYFLLDQYLCVW